MKLEGQYDYMLPKSNHDFENKYNPGLHSLEALRGDVGLGIWYFPSKDDALGAVKHLKKFEDVTLIKLSDESEPDCSFLIEEIST